MEKPNNVEGHQARYRALTQSKPLEEALQLYVGGNTDRVSIGHREKEAIARYQELDGAYVIDIGCGIGRLTKFLIDSPIRKYLGTDVVPEVLAHAASLVADDPRFTFQGVSDVTIPEESNSADIVCAFSVITHLLDEEVLRYLMEASRVLKKNGTAVFSFLDFGLEQHQVSFIEFVTKRHLRHDVLKWHEKSTLSFFAKSSGLEVIGFQDSGAPAPTKFAGTRLSDGRIIGSTFTIGQSLIYLRKS